jgi:hypothetical protein
MSPKYSMLALLGFMTYCGIALAALRDLQSFWMEVHVWFWIVLIASAGSQALLRNPRPPFSTGVILGVLIYQLCIVVGCCVGMDRFPFSYYEVPKWGQVTTLSDRAVFFSALNCSLLCGIVCGGVNTFVFRR